ncbi:unnamed protein product [Mytilus edulis]|uniref:Uncharacterized protein n=1 Tax=Mytilus edulis TaxID=6550 RepID=A0A8S3U362_MYTED|nr:unnamed protein product [Mytilus edulis]
MLDEIDMVDEYLFFKLEKEYEKDKKFGTEIDIAMTELAETAIGKPLYDEEYLNLTDKYLVPRKLVTNIRKRNDLEDRIASLENTTKEQVKESGHRLILQSLKSKVDIFIASIDEHLYDPNVSKIEKKNSVKSNPQLASAIKLVTQGSVKSSLTVKKERKKYTMSEWSNNTFAILGIQIDTSTPTKSSDDTSQASTANTGTAELEEAESIIYSNSTSMVNDSLKISGIEEQTIFHCSYCSYKTNNKSNFNKHKKDVNCSSNKPVPNEKKFICHRCTEEYKTKYGLSIHCKKT